LPVLQRDRLIRLWSPELRFSHSQTVTARRPSRRSVIYFQVPLCACGRPRRTLFVLRCQVLCSSRLSRASFPKNFWLRLEVRKVLTVLCPLHHFMRNLLLNLYGAFTGLLKVYKLFIFSKIDQLNFNSLVIECQCRISSGPMKQTLVSYGTIKKLQQGRASPADSDVSQIVSRLSSLACIIILPARIAGIPQSPVSSSTYRNSGGKLARLRHITILRIKLSSTGIVRPLGHCQSQLSSGSLAVM
jgi:hypothetical protein